MIIFKNEKGDVIADIDLKERQLFPLIKGFYCLKDTEGKLHFVTIEKLIERKMVGYDERVVFEAKEVSKEQIDYLFT